MSTKKKGAAAKGTALATRPKTGTSLSLYGEDAGGGFETMGREDFAIPFIGPLQSQSPQVMEDSGKHIPGAKAGMLFNTVTNELFDAKTGVILIPVHRTHSFIEWVPRDQGGGLVAVHAPDAQEVLDARAGQKFGKVKIGDNDLVETFSVFCLLVRSLKSKATEQVIINFSSSQIKAYKQWMTRAASLQVETEEGSVRPPLWAHLYRVTTAKQRNKKGEWYGMLVNFAEASAEASRLGPKDVLYREARAFRQLAAADDLRAVRTTIKRSEAAAQATAAGEEDDGQL